MRFRSPVGQRVPQKVYLTGEVRQMAFRKSLRVGFAMALSGAICQVSLADCNCSVPPSPAMSSGFAAPAQWSSAPHQGATYPGYGNYGYQNYGYASSPGSMSATAYGTTPFTGTAGDPDGPYAAPGGYEGRIGSPVYYHDPAGGQYVVTGNPYYDHFGPGFQRNDLHGHYRFPYYSYRAPWYYPGKAVYNRNTNFPW